MSPSADVAIRVANLSKMYKVYYKPSDMFWELVRGKGRYREFWALRDVSFEVKRGQVVGIVGRNGAGKSTLLKIITGTLDKTSGEVEVRGRVSSILELGTGFNAEYSGRENVYLGGLMVGMTREEVRRKMDWIIQFAELESVIDQPFKTYSTGMQARLTFSTAVCIDPDILIVDEALAVGDAKFARKCFGKIDEFRQAGRTILLVSHDVNTVSTFCDHAILLEQGRTVEQGEPKHISKVYYNLLFGQQPLSGGQEEPAQSPPQVEGETAAGPIQQTADREQRESEMRAAVLQAARVYVPGDPKQADHLDEVRSDELRCGSRREAEVVDFGIRDRDGNRVTLLESGRDYTFFMYAVFHEDVSTPMYSFHIRNARGVDMFGMDTGFAGVSIRPHHRGEILEGLLHVRMWLTNGDYFLSAGIGDAVARVPFDFRYDGLLFTISLLPGIQHASVVNLQPQFSFTSLKLDTAARTETLQLRDEEGKTRGS